MLHLVFKPLTDDALLQRLAAGDDVVFLENALLALTRRGKLATSLLEANKHCRFFALREQLAVRGLLAEELVSGIEWIDYPGLVALTVKNELIQSWT